MSPVEDDLTLQARRLPRTMEPARDLWPAIEAGLRDESGLGGNLEAGSGAGIRISSRIGSRIGKEEPSTVDAIRSRWQITAIAAGLLLAVVLGFWLGDAQNQPGATQISALQPADREPATAVLVPALLGVAPDLHQTRSALAESIFTRINTLPPDSRDVVTESLHTINQALDKIDQALSQVPPSGLDRHLLMSMYVDQLALLTAMNRLIRSPNQNPNQEIVL